MDVGGNRGLDRGAHLAQEAASFLAIHSTKGFYGTPVRLVVAGLEYEIDSRCIGDLPDAGSNFTKKRIRLDHARAEKEKRAIATETVGSDRDGVRSVGHEEVKGET